MTVLVTGGSGFIGRRLKRMQPDWVYLASKDCDLKNLDETLETFAFYKPAAVLHLAARVGGIKDNSENQATYFFDNIIMNTNVIHASYVTGINRVLATLSTCAFPDVLQSYPFAEKDLFSGPPAKTNFSYGITKRALYSQIIAYRKQYNVEYSAFCPSNIYGPDDKFDINKSHFVASLVRKLFDANDGDIIELWGSGNPLRQQLYVDDLCEIIQTLLEVHATAAPVIVANDENLSIRDMAVTAAAILNKDVKFVFNGRLEGQHRKDGSNDQLLDLIGDYKFTKFKDGVKKTYNWYAENR